MSVERKNFGIMPRQDKLIQKIQERKGIVSKSEVVRQAIEAYADQIGVDKNE